jgi:hypothetical protein
LQHTVFDIEGDGFDMTKVHVLSYIDATMDKPRSIYDLSDIEAFFAEDRVFIGHYIIGFDLVQLRKFVTVGDIKKVDTLPLSWYLNFDRPEHGLGSYGTDYGIPKPVVTDWVNITREEATHRCEEDVKINWRLWKDLDRKLKRMYTEDADKQKLISYLNFKMECAAEQEALGVHLNVSKAQGHYDELLIAQAQKVEELKSVMPNRIVYKKKSKPQSTHNNNGELSAYGERWYALLRSLKLPESAIGPVTVVDKEEEPNPGSPAQVKDWLFSLGWEPCTYKFDRHKKTGEEKKIEQVRNQKGHSREGELCDSVLELIDKEPSVAVLEGLTIINHRLTVFKGFLEAVNEDGMVKATIAGLTNTLRFKHSKPFVNLPGVDKPWGTEIRGCITAPDGFMLCGADMVSLEDTTKRHYIQPHDPDYVAEMSKDGYDPHLDLAKFAGEITQGDIDKHNSGEHSLSALRKSYKTTNYSATYGVRPKKLSRTAGITVKKATELLDAFWKRNWAVEKVASDCKVRNLDGQMWLKNPVSGFYHSLRYDKDRFSTLNQSTGTYCFDTWLYYCRKAGVEVVFQSHDEMGSYCKIGNEEALEGVLRIAMDKLNDKLNLNVKLGIDVQFGNNYAETH